MIRIKELFARNGVKVNGVVDIKFVALSKQAKMPAKDFEWDAGFNLWATKVDFHSHPMYVEYETDIAIELPKNYVALVFSRSSVRDKMLTMANCVGVVDSTYRGSIKLSFRRYKNEYGNSAILRKLINLGLASEADYELAQKNEKKYFHAPITDKYYGVGDKVGQLVIVKLDDFRFVKVNKLSPSPRSTGGHGSTGRK